MSKESNIPDGPNPFEGAAEDPTQVFASPAAPDSTQSFPTAPDATQPFPTTPDATQSFPTAPDATQSFPAAPAEEPHVFGAPVPPNEQPAWSQTDQPTPAPNPYTSQGYPVAVAPKERTLSNGVAFAAVGAMAIIAAIGLLFFFGAGMTNLSGQAVLISVGLIVVVAAAVLIYAAMKGLRPGWFLPFTIVGALFAVPVAAVGGAMTAYTYVENSPGFGGHWTDEDWFDEGSEDSGWQDETFLDDTWEMGNVGGPIVAVDPSETKIIGNGEFLLLNLTEIDDVHDLKYDVALNDSEMTVLLTDDQLPLVPTWSEDASSMFEGEALLPFSNDDITWQLRDWIDSSFAAESYPFGLGEKGADPDATISFAVTLNNGSTMRFVIVDEDVMGHWSPRHSTDQGAQSGRGTHPGQTSGSTQTDTNDGGN